MDGSTGLVHHAAYVLGPLYVTTSLSSSNVTKYSVHFKASATSIPVSCLRILLVLHNVAPQFLKYEEISRELGAEGKEVAAISIQSQVSQARQRLETINFNLNDRLKTDTGRYGWIPMPGDPPIVQQDIPPLERQYAGPTVGKTEPTPKPKRDKAILPFEPGDEVVTTAPIPYFHRQRNLMCPTGTHGVVEDCGLLPEAFVTRDWALIRKRVPWAMVTFGPLGKAYVRAAQLKKSKVSL